jgi:hypothetical protein
MADPLPSDAVEPYPLSWPHHWPRTRMHKRRDSKFAKHSFGQIRDGLLAELRRMGVRRVTLTTDIPVRADGLPYSGRREPDDPGAAVYFQWRGEPYVIACDNYRRVWENVKAIGKTVEAMRAIERHGASQLLERAVAGFSALPPGEGSNGESRPREAWWDVLGLASKTVSGMGGADLAKIAASPDHPLRPSLLGIAETMYRSKVKAAHPDRGGSTEAMTRLNGAIAQAREQLT